MAFDELSSRAQVHRLRATALAALAHYPIEVAGLRLVSHAFNTTFRVDTADGRPFALRINVNSRREPAWIDAETAWVDAIARDTSVVVPTPQRTHDGALRTSVFSPDLGRDLPAILYSWLPGRDLDDGATVDQMREVGRTMATLHTHAESWSMPAGAALPVFDDPLFGAPDVISESDLPELTDARRAVFRETHERTSAAFATMYAGATPIALHADLHQWNMKWHRGRLSVFDFDDSGFGVPLLDLATTAYYIRRVDPALEAAVHDGYTERRPLPAGGDDQYEAVLASRNLLLVNDVLTTVNATMRAELARYVVTSAVRLRHYLDHGTYQFVDADITQP